MSEKTETYTMRILLAFEKKHTTHMDAVRLAIRGYRSDTEMMVIEPGALEEKIERFDPHLVVCEGAIPENADSKVPARIELSIDPSQPSKFRVGQRCWESLQRCSQRLTSQIEGELLRMRGYSYGNDNQGLNTNEYRCKPWNKRIAIDRR